MSVTLLDRLEECVRKRKLNTSSAREEVLRIFSEHPGCISSEDLHRLVNESYPKKISQNTVYRILRLLEECGLIVAIPTGQKRTLYSLADEKRLPVCALCPECGEATMIEVPDDVKHFFSAAKELRVVVIHKKCKICN